MIRRELPKQSEIHRAVIIVLGLAAISGWGAFALTSRSSAEIEDQLRGQISSLQETHVQLISERAQAQATMGEWEQLRVQIPTVREELRQMTDARDQAQAGLVLAQMGLSELVGKNVQIDGDVSTTGSIKAKAPDAKHVVAATAQKALTKLGYGKLTADGAIGPGTRRAIEAFQKDKGLTVTSELDAPTLHQLSSAMKVSTR